MASRAAAALDGRLRGVAGGRGRSSRWLRRQRGLFRNGFRGEAGEAEPKVLLDRRRASAAHALLSSLVPVHRGGGGDGDDDGDLDDAGVRVVFGVEATDAPG